jgi:hypothetical protein
VRSPTGTCRRPADTPLAPDHRRCRSCSRRCPHSSLSRPYRTAASDWRTSPPGQRHTTSLGRAHRLRSPRVKRSMVPPWARRSSWSRELRPPSPRSAAGPERRVRSSTWSPVPSSVPSPAAEDQRLSTWWTRDAPLRSSPLVKAGRRCRTKSAHLREATSRHRRRSPRVMRVPIRAAARGEALRTRHHRGLRRRRGASPECSVSAGLHPSPGTVHPRRHQVGGGDGENIGTSRALVQMKIDEQRNRNFISPGQGTTPKFHFHE